MEQNLNTNNFYPATTNPSENHSISNSTDVLSFTTSPAYFSEIRNQEFIFSIDNLIVNYFFENRENMKLVMDFLENQDPLLHGAFYTFKKTFENTSFQNKDIYNVCLNNGSTVHIEFITYRLNVPHKHVCKIEFNPNKCYGNYAEFVGNNYLTGETTAFIKTDLLDYLITFIYKSATHVKIMKFDLAVDIPVNRCCVYILKDNRSFYRYVPAASRIDDYTDYLGTQHESGYTKVYNKAAESKLPYDLTRAEMTSIYHDNYEKFNRQWPEIYACTNEYEIPNFLPKLNSTENVIVRALFYSPEKDTLFKGLGRQMQKKLKPYLYGFNGCVDITVPKEVYAELMDRMYKMLGIKNDSANCHMLNSN